MTLLQSYLEFIKELELLKNITRTAWTSAGKKESTAEHSWRLALFTGIISQEFPELDGKKLLMMALVQSMTAIFLPPCCRIRMRSTNQRPDRSADCYPFWRNRPAAASLPSGRNMKTAERQKQN